MRPISAAYIPPALTTTSASIVAPLGPTRRAPGRRSTSIPVTRVEVKISHAAPARAVGQRVGELGGVEVAVGGDARAARARRRWTSAGTSPSPRRRRSAPSAGRRSSPSPPGGAAPPSAPRSRPAGCRRTRSSPGRTPTPRRAAGRARPSTSSSWSATPSRAAGPTRPAEWKVEPEVSWLRSSSTTSSQPELGQVVGDRRPADAAADDHAAGGGGQLTPARHAPPRASGRSAGRRPSRAAARSASSA